MRHKPKITHILADGRKVSTVKGLTVPGDNIVYSVLLATAKGVRGADEKSTA